MRNYLSKETRERLYRSSEKPDEVDRVAKEQHERGEILVLAVYDAFLAIVARRTEDLIRIATGGTGKLPDGALHPDLVERLTDETCKSAEHVLRMCIRALDYAPSMDINFGDFLRALITADVDFVANDDLGYRIAFMESFRNRGIPIRDVKTISTETLTWNSPADDKPQWLRDAIGGLDLGLDKALTSKQLAELNENNRKVFWRALNEAFAADKNLCWQFGLRDGEAKYDMDGKKLPETPQLGPTTFQVYQVRGARRITPDGSVQTSLTAIITQRRPELVDPETPDAGFFWFRSGATLVIDVDPQGPKIRYIIIKSASSERRLMIQREQAQGSFMSPLRALYFGNAGQEPFALIHASRRGHDHG